MAIQWLTDKPDLDNLSITIRERSRGHHMTLSKSLKDLIRVEKYTHIRIGYEPLYGGAIRLAIQLVKEDVGLPILNDKGAIKLYLDITDYINQIIGENGIAIPEVIADLPLKIRKGSILESSELPLDDKK